jgi:hypothetical protein
MVDPFSHKAPEYRLNQSERTIIQLGAICAGELALRPIRAKASWHLRLTFALYSPRLYGMDKQRENGALLIAASIVAAIRLRASRSAGTKVQDTNRLSDTGAPAIGLAVAPQIPRCLKTHVQRPSMMTITCGDCCRSQQLTFGEYVNSVD